MKDTEHLPRILLGLADSLREAADRAERAAWLLSDAKPAGSEETGLGELHIDHDTLTVRWNGDACFLGYTVAFRLMDRLALRPNHYVSHDRLLDDVWGGQRSKSAIRSAVSDLKARLIQARMSDLADAIDGRTPGHYALLLNGYRRPR